MKKIIIIILVSLILIFILFVVSRKIKFNKSVKDDRANFNGLTRSELTDALQEAWRLREIQGTYDYIMNGEDDQARQWRQEIENKIVELGISDTLEDEVMKHAIFVSPNRHKAWGVEWSRLWIGWYAKEDLGLDIDKKEVNDILTTI